MKTLMSRLPRHRRFRLVLDQWPISLQSFGANKWCVFVIESMQGIEEPSKDLETLKHILKALQIKGLLHSKNAKNQMSHQNFVYNRNNESPIVVMKPARSSTSRISHGGIELPPSSIRSWTGPCRDWPVSVQSSGVDKRCECTTPKGVRSCLLAIYFYFYFFHSP